MSELLTKQGQFANKNHVIFLVSRKLHSSFKEISLYHVCRASSLAQNDHRTKKWFYLISGNHEVMG